MQNYNYNFVEPGHSIINFFPQDYESDFLNWSEQQAWEFGNDWPFTLQSTIGCPPVIDRIEYVVKFHVNLRTDTRTEYSHKALENALDPCLINVIKQMMNAITTIHHEMLK